MGSETILNTQRLTLRPFELTDAPFILELVNSPKWIEFIGDRDIKTNEAAIEYLRNGPIKSYKEHGFGLWLVALQDAGQPIGMCGLLQRDYLQHPDIGFAILPDYLGKGYGSEIARETLVYARVKLGIECIMAITDRNNVVSIKLLNKLGMQFERSITSPQNEQLLLFSTQVADEDSKSIDLVTKKFFSVFNNLENKKLDLSILNSICIPEAFIVNNTDSTLIYTLQNFIRSREQILTDGSLINFSEFELAHNTKIFGNMAQRFCLYSKSGELLGSKFENIGMKSIQYLLMDNQWKIASVVWSDTI